MAVQKIYRCDVCGDPIEPRPVDNKPSLTSYQDALAIVRVGTLQDRPEDCTRLDVGRCCDGQPVSALLAAAREKM